MCLYMRLSIYIIGIYIYIYIYALNIFYCCIKGGSFKNHSITSVKKKMVKNSPDVLNLIRSGKG